MGCCEFSKNNAGPPIGGPGIGLKPEPLFRRVEEQFFFLLDDDVGSDNREEAETQLFGAVFLGRL